MRILSVLIGCLLFTLPAEAQTKDELAGVWAIVKNETIKPDGSREPTFGENPHGQLILAPNGHFSQIFIRADIPKIASNNRLAVTTEEATAIAKSINVAFGTWTLEDKTVTLKVTASTFANWAGTDQKRPIVKFSADEIVWTVAAGSAGNRIESVWKRMQ